jgi:hypothetical protein
MNHTESDSKATKYLFIYKHSPGKCEFFCLIFALDGFLENKKRCTSHILCALKSLIWFSASTKIKNPSF